MSSRYYDRDYPRDPERGSERYGRRQDYSNNRDWNTDRANSYRTTGRRESARYDRGRDYQDYEPTREGDYGRYGTDDYRWRRDYDRDTYTGSYEGRDLRAYGGGMRDRYRDAYRNSYSQPTDRNSGQFGYRANDYTRGYEGDYDRDRDESDYDERGWWERASDTVASWLGDEDAARRRQMDEQRSRHHRGRGPKGYRRSDSRIEEDINERMTDHPFLDATEVEVKVENGEVTLSGKVESRYAKRLAEDLAESASGVRQVQNNLRVETNDSWSGERSYGTTTATSGLSNGETTPVTGTSTGLAHTKTSSGLT